MLSVSNVNTNATMIPVKEKSKRGTKSLKNEPKQESDDFLGPRLHFSPPTLQTEHSFRYMKCDVDTSAETMHFQVQCFVPPGYFSATSIAASADGRSVVNIPVQSPNDISLFRALDRSLVQLVHKNRLSWFQKDFPLNVVETLMGSVLQETHESDGDEDTTKTTVQVSVGEQQNNFEPSIVVRKIEAFSTSDLSSPPLASAAAPSEVTSDLTCANNHFVVFYLQLNGLRFFKSQSICDLQLRAMDVTCIFDEEDNADNVGNADNTAAAAAFVFGEENNEPQPPSTTMDEENEVFMLQQTFANTEDMDCVFDADRSNDQKLKMEALSTVNIEHSAVEEDGCVGVPMEVFATGHSHPMFTAETMDPANLSPSTLRHQIDNIQTRTDACVMTLMQTKMKLADMQRALDRDVVAEDLNSIFETVQYVHSMLISMEKNRFFSSDDAADTVVSELE